MTRCIVRLASGASIPVLMAIVSLATVGADDRTKPTDSVPEAEVKAAQILTASHDYVAGHSVEIQQTTEQTATVLVDEKPLGSPQTIKQTSRIEIDFAKGLVRMTTKDQSGKDLVIIRKGEHIAMKIGTDPWTAPTGPYERIGDQLANPFACPLPRPGKANSPRWTIVSEEHVDGQELTLIKTVGDTANAYTQERMRDGIASIFPEASARPTIEVLTYESRHWIGKMDNSRQRVEQTSHHKMTMPGTEKTVIDVVGKTTAIYSRYNKIDIDVPEEARRIPGPQLK
jgi:hypothetical protein